jgi:hypothetical protein
MVVSKKPTEREVLEVKIRLLPGRTMSLIEVAVDRKVKIREFGKLWLRRIQS